MSHDDAMNEQLSSLLPQFFQALALLPQPNSPLPTSSSSSASSSISETDKVKSTPLSESGGSPFVSWPVMEQFPDVVRRGENEHSEKWRKTGLRAIHEGRVAMVVMAGGQGTRLGSPLPKGMFDMGLPSKKSLFRLQAEKLQRIAQVAAEASPNQPAVPRSIAYYVLTSESTEQVTRQYFIEHQYFGLRPEDVMFIEQASVLCLTPEGKPVPNSLTSYAVSPNGNGGVYEALSAGGALDDMAKRGVQAVMIAGIDNGLLRVVDPEFMGMLIDEQLESALKVVPKAYAHERVGVFGLRASRPSVIEYSELDPKLAAEIDPRTGSFRFNTGNICIHAFSLDFLVRCSSDEIVNGMPYHLAFKAVPYWNFETMRLEEPAEPNAYKLEKFVFDVFPFSTRVKAMQVDRSEEFAPLKNAPGASTDTPETARTLICSLHRRWVRENGGTIDAPDDALLEVSPLLSYEGEGLQALVANRTFTPPLCLEKQ